MTVVLDFRRLVFRSFGAGSCDYLCVVGRFWLHLLLRVRGGNFGHFLELREE